MKLTKEKIDLLINGSREERAYATAKSFKLFCIFYFTSTSAISPRRFAMTSLMEALTYGRVTNSATKYTILSDLRTAVEDGLLAIQDMRILLEMKSFTDADDFGRNRMGHFTTTSTCSWPAPIAWEMRKHAKPKMMTPDYQQPDYERTGLDR